MALVHCPDCGRNVSTAAADCPNCGRPTRPLTPPELEPVLPRVVGLLGAALLFVGVFSPMVRIPIVGIQSYFQNVQGGGAVTIVLAVAAGLLSLAKRYRLLWIPGLAALGTTIFSYLYVKSNLDNLRSEIQRQLGNIEDNPFQGLTDMVMSIEMQWGWAVLLLGSIVICAAAVIASPSPDQSIGRIILPR